MKKLNTFGSRIIAGYAFILGFIVLLVVAVFIQTGVINRVATGISEKRLPITEHSLQMLNGINASIAALNGWVVTGDENYKAATERGLPEEVEHAFQKINQLTADDNDQNLKVAMAQADNVLDDFTKHVLAVKSIANTEDNNPAKKLLLTAGAKHIEAIKQSIGALVDEEKQQVATYQRKALLGNMADFRGNFSLGLSALNAYVMTGEQRFREETENRWQASDKSLGEITSKLPLLSPSQKQSYILLKNDYAGLKNLSERVIDIRSGKDWNAARSVISNALEPATQKINHILEDVASMQGERAKEDMQSLSSMIRNLDFFMWGALLFVIALCAGMAWLTIRSVTDPIRSAIEAAKKIAKHDQDILFDERGAAEIIALNQALSAMHQEIATQVEALSESNIKTKAILDTAVDAIITITDKGVIQSFNRGAEVMFGYKADEIIGKKVNMLMPIKISSEHDGYLDCYDSGSGASVIGKAREVDAKRKDGISFPIALSVGEIKLNGETLFTGIVRDISEQRENFRQITAKNDALEKQNWVKNNLTDLLDKLTQCQNATSVCQTSISVLSEVLHAGYGAVYLMEENECLSLQGCYAYEERKKVANKIALKEGLVGQAAFEKKTIVLSEVPEDYVKVQSSLGEHKPFNVIVVPLMVQEAGENVVKGVIELGSFNVFQDSEKELLNLSSEAIAGQVHSLQSRVRTEKLLQESQELASQLAEQQEALRENNKKLVAQAESLRQSEEELRVSNEELEEKSKALEVQKDKIEKKNKEVVAAQAAIEEKANALQSASQYKTEFLANMSHELRTPLNSLLILSETMLKNPEGNLTEKQLESMRFINSGGKELLELINDILDLSKVEAGKVDIVIENTNIQDMLQELSVQFDPVSKRSGVPLIVDVEASAPADIQTDERRLRQILKNLLSNAFKFTSQGSVTLCVHHRDDGALCFSVTDTGIGIKPEKQKDIFEAFQQEDGTTSRQYGGTGLGLTISRKLAKLLGGHLTVESKVGEGSTFTFVMGEMVTQNEVSTVPARQAEVVTEVFIADDRDTITDENSVVLIVEDDRSFAKILLDESRSKGFKGVCAGTGDSALVLAEQYKPDAIIVDLGLPDMSGQEVIEKIKSDADFSEVPIHIVSGSESVGQIAENHQIGFLKKPASLEDVQGLLSALKLKLQNGLKNLLLVSSDSHSSLEKTFAAIEDLNVITLDTEKFASAKAEDYDCLIVEVAEDEVDLSSVLATLARDDSWLLNPVVIYSARDLSEEETKALSGENSTVIIKGPESETRLLDECAMFLKSVESTLPNHNAPTEIISNIDDRLKGHKILLVDDDVRNTFALSSLLNTHGLDVVMADNGQHAIDKLEKENDIELVLMDIMMPVMDGYEAIETIRKSSAPYKNVPIFAVTAKSMQEDKEKALSIGATDYVLKPVDENRLISLMAIHLYEHG